MWSERSRNGGIDEIPLPSGTGEGARLWLCGKHWIATDVEARLQEIGADTVVCLTQRHELEDRYPAYLAWLLAEQGGERALWFPVPDLAVLGPREMRALFDDVTTRLRGGRRVVVHCAAGIGRAGTTAVALLMLLGAPAADALATVRSHRPMAGPEVGAQADLIAALAAELAADRSA